MTDSLPPEARSKAISYWEKMGQLNLLSGVMGQKVLSQNQREQQRNQEAESSWVRRNAWGDAVEATDEMGDQTILGDVTNPTPIIVQGGGNGGGASLLTLALGAVLGGGGIWLGQMMSKPIVPATPAVDAAQVQQQPIQQAATNQGTTTTIGLGRIEDYLGQAGAGK